MIRHIRNLILLLLLAVPVRAGAGQAPDTAGNLGLHEGDIIFIESQSAQAAAILEIAGSSWTHVGVAVSSGSAWNVAEAGRDVRLTPLREFLDRSRDHRFAVKRFKKWAKRPDKAALLSLKKWLEGNLGKPYDIYFEWSDSALYCSEYVWKAFYNALPGHPALSKIQKFSDMKLDGPLCGALIEKRYKPANKKLNPDEPIVTPVALFNSDLLQTVSQ